MLSVIHSSSTGASGFIAKSCVQRIRVPPGSSVYSHRMFMWSKGPVSTRRARTVRPGSVHGAFRDPAPDLAVVVRVHGQPEGRRVALAGEHFDGRVLAEQLGPVLEVVGHVPDEVERGVDGDLVLGVSGHFQAPALRVLLTRSRNSWGVLQRSASAGSERPYWFSSSPTMPSRPSESRPRTPEGGVRGPLQLAGVDGDAGSPLHERGQLVVGHLGGEHAGVSFPPGAIGRSRRARRTTSAALEPISPRLRTRAVRSSAGRARDITRSRSWQMSNTLGVGGIRPCSMASTAAAMSSTGAPQ